MRGKLIKISEWKKEKSNRYFEPEHAYCFEDLPVGDKIVFCSLSPNHLGFILYIKTGNNEAKKIGNLSEFKREGPQKAKGNVFSKCCSGDYFNLDDVVEVIAYLPED